MYIYIVELLSLQFSRFIREEALVSGLSFDSAPLRLFATSDASGSTEVFARIITAYSATGEQVSLQPELTALANTKVSGVLSAISPSRFVVN